MLSSKTPLIKHCSKPIATLVAALMIGGCQTNPASLLPGQYDDDKTLLKQIDREPSKSLLAIGADVDRLRQQSNGLGLVRHAAMEQELNRILAKLKKESGFEDLPGRVYLAAEISLNAKTTADGNIYIPYAALEDLEEEKLIAALLAHELAHQILGHTNSEIFVRLHKKFVAGQQLVAKLRASRNDSSVLDPTTVNRIQESLSWLAVSNSFLNPGWTRGQEADADKLGLDLLVAANYPSNSMGTLLNIVESWEANNQNLREQHAALSQKLKQEMKELEQKLDGDSRGAFSEVFGNLFSSMGQSLTSLIDDIQQQHPDTESRIAAIDTYWEKHHSSRTKSVGSKKALETDLRWANVWQRSERTKLDSALTKAFESRQAVGDKRPDSAITLALKSAQYAPNYQTFTRGQVASAYAATPRMSKRERQRLELININKALKSHYPSFKLVHRQAELEIALANPAMSPKAKIARLDQLNTQFEAFGRPPAVLSDMIRLANQVEHKTLRVALQLECNVKYAGEIADCGSSKENNTTPTLEEKSTASLLDKLF